MRRKISLIRDKSKSVDPNPQHGKDNQQGHKGDKPTPPGRDKFPTPSHSLINGKLNY